MEMNTAFSYYKSISVSTKKTVSYENSMWKNHISPCLGALDIKSVTNFNMAVLRKNLESKEMSPQSVVHCLSLAKRVLKVAMEWELDGYRGPLPTIRMPKFDNRRLRFFSHDEADELVSYVAEKDKVYSDIILFDLNTGLRRGELATLRQDNVNFAAKTVTLFDTKNGRNRVVPMNEKAMAIARLYFSSYSSTPPFTRVYKQYPLFRNAVNALKLNDGVNDRRLKLCFHSLRHTFASWLVQKGVPLAVISMLLGHRTMQMTMRYAHLIPDQGAAAVALL